MLSSDLQLSLDILLVVAGLGLLLAVRRGVPLISPYCIFIFLSVLYCSGLSSAALESDDSLSLLADQGVMNILCWTATWSIVGFTAAYFFTMRRKRRRPPQHIQYRLVGGRFWITYNSLFLISLVFASTYGWHSLTREETSPQDGMFFTLFAYVKYAYVALALVYMYANRFNKKKAVAFILLTQTLTMLVDGGRTTYFGFIVALMWLYTLDHKIKFTKSFLVAFIGVAVIIGTRALVLETDLADAFLGSVSTESVMGGYTAVQIIHEVQSYNRSLLLGASYILDPVIYLLPAGIRDSLLYLRDFTDGIENGKEGFAPMGGFYFIAEAYANFGMAGGFVMAACFGGILRWVESNAEKRLLLALVFISTIGSLFAKAVFANTFKLFTAYLIFALIFKVIFLVRRGYKKTPGFDRPKIQAQDSGQTLARQASLE